MTARIAHVPHRPGRARDPAEHRQRHPAGGQHRLHAAPGRAAGLFDGRQAACGAPGLDYHEYAEVRRHAGWDALLESMQPDAAAAVRADHARHARRSTTWRSAPGDWLVFGSETRGLAPALRERSPPAAAAAADAAGQRSLNLSNAVAVTVFEAWRQNGFGQGDSRPFRDAADRHSRTSLTAQAGGRLLPARSGSLSAELAGTPRPTRRRRPAWRAFEFDGRFPGHLHAVVGDRLARPAASCAPRSRLPTGTGDMKRTRFRP